MNMPASLCSRAKQVLHRAADMFLEVVYKKNFPEFITTYLNEDHTFLSSQRCGQMEDLDLKRARLWRSLEPWVCPFNMLVVQVSIPALLKQLWEHDCEWPFPTNINVCSMWCSYINRYVSNFMLSIFTLWVICSNSTKIFMLTQMSHFRITDF